MHILYASCVALDGGAVLLRGPSGAGKSDLALRLIALGGRLVSDDRTLLEREGDRLIARAPERIRGLLEIRGLGPVPVLPAPPTPAALILDLVPLAELPRLPEPTFESFSGLDLPVLPVEAFSASAALKVRYALGRAMAGLVFTPAEAAGMA
ncbi:HPr kinase/phosphatase C-terminal domain-containing protein [Ferrovibrio sp. MS7]|uniref:HPr kinase/phosphorylase n=1 Tax=Ferrovibrio plantarum TaxID=3119164 RepID=UPI003134DE32